MKTKTIFGISICVICAAMISGCLGTYDASSPDYGAQVPVQGAGKVVIVEHDLTICKYNDWRTVEGVVKNTGKSPITWVELKATFYDANGNIRGESRRQTSELYQGDEKSFSMVYMGTYPKNIVRYDVVIVRYLPW